MILIRLVDFKSLIKNLTTTVIMKSRNTFKSNSKQEIKVLMYWKLGFNLLFLLSKLGGDYFKFLTFHKKNYPL